jgi:hypothetical protein
MTNLEQVKLFIEENHNHTFDYLPMPAGNIWSQGNFVWNGNPAMCLDLDVNMPYAEMLSEARALRDRFVVHRMNDGQGWRSLCIHGVGSENTDSANMYGKDAADESIYDWTNIAPLCPVTTDYFKNVFPFDKYHRLRFMLVEPGGYITPHSDHNRPNLASAINISLNNPDNCYLTTELGTVPFRDSGSAFLFNNHYRHTVWNNSDTDRFHIIVHGRWRGPAYEEMIVRSYKRALDGQNS